MPPSAEASEKLDLDLLFQEWPGPADGSIYLNSGSCGLKPRSVIAALSAGWERLNLNPTRLTFLETDPLDSARALAAELFQVPERSLLLTQNTNQGLQLVLQSFLLKPGDELVTTDHEHGSLNSMCRHLEESRGIIVRRHHVEPHDGSEALCRGILGLVTDNTALVQVSEIDCYTGWRGDLALLSESLSAASIPLLVDGAHAPGQGPCRPARYPLWVGSGHKWLGGPNGTGFLFARDEFVPCLKPLWVSDRYYNQYDNELQRFEYQGTTDVVRWLGLAAACRLHLRLGPERLASRQAELVDYLRLRLSDLKGGVLRTPDNPREVTGMVTVTWSKERVGSYDLRDYLWQQHRIWIQPDFCYGEPGHGMRVSCHPSGKKEHIDSLIDALSRIL